MDLGGVTTRRERERLRAKKRERDMSTTLLQSGQGVEWQGQCCQGDLMMLFERHKSGMGCFSLVVQRFRPRAK